MCEKTIEKLKKKNGESLAEVLIAVLITAIGLFLLSSLIIASTHLVDKGTVSMRNMYNGAAALETETAEKVSDSTTQLTVTTKVNDSAQVENHVYINIYKDKDSNLASYEKINN